MNDTRQWYFIYNKELYAVVQALYYCRHYLLPQEFIIYSDYEALKYLNFQKKLNLRYGRWVEFLQDYSYVLKHKTGSKIESLMHLAVVGVAPCFLSRVLKWLALRNERHL